MKTADTAQEDSAFPSSDRHAGPVDPALGFGVFRLDTVKRRLYRGEAQLSLSPKAMETLLVLIEHRGRIVDKDELMERVWPKTYVGDDSVAQCISALRHALDDNAAHPEFILTIPRRGYEFIATVAAIQNDPALAQQPTNIVLPPAAPPTPPRSRSWKRMLAVGAVVLLMGLSSGVLFFGPSATTLPRSLRFPEAPPQGRTLSGDAAVSPDGQYLAYVATTDGGRSQLWLRRLDSVDPQPLAGTEGATLPFWSPDSRSIGFFAHRWLKTVSLANGVVRPLTKVLLVPAGGTWNTIDLILYGTRTSPLHAIPASGGVPSAATSLDPVGQEHGHAFPQFLPDGQHFLYSVISPNASRSGVYVGSLGSSQARRLLDDSFHAVTYSATGHLLFVKNALLMAQAFDLDTLSLVGQARPLADAALPWHSQAVSMSASGPLLAVGGRAERRQLRWYDRAGRALAGVSASTELRTPALSSEGSQLVASSDDPDLSGIWLVDLARGGSSRIVPDGIVPIWSPRGDRVAYASHRRSGVLDIYVKSLGADGTDRLLLQNERSKGVTDWSPDGRYLVLNMANEQNDIDIWLLDTVTETARPWLQTSANEMQGRMSPDGRWIVYTSDETGRWEVYLRSFPTPGVKRAVSVVGGAQPSWRADGGEIYYLSPERELTAVSVAPGTTRLGRPQVLFRVPVSTDLVRRRNLYAPTADGQRFLVDTENVDGGVVSILDWQARIVAD